MVMEKIVFSNIFWSNFVCQKNIANQADRISPLARDLKEIRKVIYLIARIS